MAIPLSSSDTTAPTPLTFPPSAFAKLAPRSYLHAHLSSPAARRPSGRLPSESRKSSINTGSLTHCHGSAVVRTGDTAVVCGIRGEILNAEDVLDYKPATTVDDLLERYGGSGIHLHEVKDEGMKRRCRGADAEEMAYLNLLVPNVELSTGCSPAYLPGGPPSEEAQSLSHRILSLLHTTQLLSMDDLRIWYHPLSLDTPTASDANVPTATTEEERSQQQQPTVKAYWTLHITLLPLSLSGPPFATLWTALVAALRDTRLPSARWDPDLDSMICSPAILEAKPLRLNGLPMAVGFGVFDAGRDAGGLVSNTQGKGEKRWVLVDMDGFEAAVCGEEVTVVVRGPRDGADERMEVLRFEKGGGGVVGRREMRDVVEMAGSRWREWRELVEGS